MLTEAGFLKGLKTQLIATPGYGHDLIDAVQVVLRYLKEVGIEAELKLAGVWGIYGDDGPR
jgi:hypothetical protein